ncbi:MAG: FkbM family methyltransferase, partial [Clostridia bacterium]|nr:FkbM family methyltransferase [Clostridia bacterium]
MIFSEFVSALPDCDIWQYLKSTGRSIVMYGMGNGADKIISRLDALGVEIADFFASDGFVRGQYFHNKRVLSFSEIKEKYKDPIILVSFGSEREEVIGLISEISQSYELYLPDVPVAGEEVFDRGFFDKHINEIERAYNAFDDELSRRVFCDVIAYKLTGKIEYLLENTQSDTEVYTELFDLKKWSCTADLGAYNGDSAAFVSELAPGVKRIIAFEPDRKNFIKLENNTKELGVTVEAHNVCAWSEKTTLFFERGGNRNSTVSDIGHTASRGDTKKVEVQADTLDNILDGRGVDFIKFDVEGSELDAICGCENTIRAFLPDMLVSGYHRSEDIFVLPLKLKELLPAHRIYFRRKRCLPA